jgi:hypothetical protein
MRPGARAFAVVSWLGLAALATPGCYAPDVASGTLRCGTGGSCPAGYSCRTEDKTCWKDGEKAAMGPQGGDVGLAFEGHWLFVEPAMNVTTCNDGSRVPRSLKDDWIDVTAGGKGDFSASYYCDWDLNIAPNGKSATLDSAASCNQDDRDDVTDAVTTRFVWTGKSFTFTKTGAASAVVNAEVGAAYTKVLNCTAPGTCVPCVTGCTGTCTIMISGPLTKTD